MSNSSRVFITAVLAFISTTLDDFAVILMFFGKANSSENVRLGYIRTVIGMTLGFTFIIAISLIGLVMGHFLPGKYVALMGFIPLLIGIQKLYEVLRDDGYLRLCGLKPENEEEVHDRERNSSDGLTLFEGHNVATSKTDIDSSRHKNLLNHDSLTENPILDCRIGEAHNFSTLESKYEASKPTDDNDDDDGLKITIGGDSQIEVDNTSHAIPTENSSDNLAQENDNQGDEEEAESTFLSRLVTRLCKNCLDSFTLEVLGFAIACSSDNIAIYISLFSSTTTLDVFIVIVIFYLMLAVNLSIAMMMMRVRANAHYLCNKASISQLLRISYLLRPLFGSDADHRKYLRGLLFALTSKLYP